MKRGGITVGKAVFGTRRGFFGLAFAIIHFVKPKQIHLDDKAE